MAVALSKAVELGFQTVGCASTGNLAGSVAANAAAAGLEAYILIPDGLEQVAQAGATAIIQPGGSLKDADVIEAADKAGLAMVFSGVRQFRH